MLECVLEAGAVLGEGPVWDDRQGCLYWVDIVRRSINRWADGDCELWMMPTRVGCVGLRNDATSLVAGLETGFVFVDLAASRVHAIADPEPDLPGNRFNDGKVDSAGRFWAGTLDESETHETGALYCLDTDRQVTRKDTGYIVTNGPAWSPDGRTMYHNDTLKRVVYAFDFDPATGEIGNKRVFRQLEPEDGYPDGMTIDADGGLWLAHWDGWKVTRFTPGGDVDRVIEVPAARVTSCAFGGPDLRTLYITTATVGLDAAALAEQPLAGGLFAIETDAVGLPANRYGG